MSTNRDHRTARSTYQPERRDHQPERRDYPAERRDYPDRRPEPTQAPAVHVHLPRRSLREGTQLDVVCEELDASGCGLARCLDEAPTGPTQSSALPSALPSALAGQPLIQVPNLLPGERAHVKVGHVSPHVSPSLNSPNATPGAVRRPAAFATLMRRHNAAAEREIPACAAFGQCGGCTLQHLQYAAQLRFKQEVVTQALFPVIAQNASGITVDPCVASPQPLHYRTRVKLIAAPAPSDPGHPELAAGRIILGAYAPRSHRVIDMAGCKVNTPPLRAVARTLAEAWSQNNLSVYDESAGSGSLRYVLLREVQSGAMQVSLIVASPPPRDALLVVLSALRAAHPKLVSVVLHHNPHTGNALLAADQSGGQRGGQSSGQNDGQNDGQSDGAAATDSELGSDESLFGPLFLEEELGEVARPAAPRLRIRVSARSFLQVNRAVASQLYSDVAAALPVAAGETILDLYCGVGGLGRTVLAASPGARLIGIEANPSAIADAEASASAAGLAGEQARFLSGAVEDQLPGLLSSSAAGASPGSTTVVLLNPPRRGCTKAVLDAVIAGAPRRLAYVSCNPQSLARDLAALTAAGYRVTAVTPYDMHPGTPHIETLALLAR